MAGSLRVVVANAYSRNRDRPGFTRWVAQRNADAALVCEAHGLRWGEHDNLVNHNQRTWKRPGVNKSRRDCTVVTRPRVDVHSSRTVKVADDAGTGVTPARYVCVVRAEAHAVPVSFISAHGHPFRSRGRDEWVRQGLRNLAEVIKEEREAGYVVVLGGDLNEHEHVGHTAAWLDRHDLTWRADELMWLAWDRSAPLVFRNLTIRQRVPGSDHPALDVLFEVQPRRYTGQRPERPKRHRKRPGRRRHRVAPAGPTRAARVARALSLYPHPKEH